MNEITLMHHTVGYSGDSVMGEFGHLSGERIPLDIMARFERGEYQHIGYRLRYKDGKVIVNDT